MGIIYLLQPCELVGTNRYKIGMSSKTDLSRIKSYKNGSRYISIMECKNYLNVERIIKQEFDLKFKRIAGREFYEGDEQEMLDMFINIVLKNKDETLIKFEVIFEDTMLNDTFEINDKQKNNILKKNKLQKKWMDDFGFKR